MKLSEHHAIEALKTVPMEKLRKPMDSADLANYVFNYMGANTPIDAVADMTDYIKKDWWYYVATLIAFRNK